MRELSDDMVWRYLGADKAECISLRIVDVFRAGYAAGYRAAQAAMPPRAYSQSEARRIAVTVLRERGAHLVAALKGGSEYDGSNLIALMQLHARAMYDAWQNEQTSGSTEGRAANTSARNSTNDSFRSATDEAALPSRSVQPSHGAVANREQFAPDATAGIKPGPLDRQSAATPAAGRPDAGAAQAVTDGPAADPLPVAWATPSLLVTMSAVEKRRLTSPEMRGRGGEWEADARDADLYSVPLYRADALERLRAERDAARSMATYAMSMQWKAESAERSHAECVSALIAERETLREIVRAMVAPDKDSSAANLAALLAIRAKWEDKA